MVTKEEKAERFENGLISESETEEYFLGKDPRKTKYYKENAGK